MFLVALEKNYEVYILS